MRNISDMKKILLLLLLTGTFPSASAQGLSRTERKIVATVSRHAPEAVAFLEEVVNINSGTLNLEGVKQVGGVFGEAFAGIGFDVRWIDMPDSLNRAGHLFAETKGKRGKRLLLIGHLDTVFEENSPFQRFERVNDTLAHAPGGNDMKGGDVIVLYALKALHENGLLKDTQIIVAFTGDEESTGHPLEVSRRDLIEAARRSDVALGFENATSFQEATVARRGNSGWKVEARGVRAHSSGIFSEETGAGAIFELSRILNSFYDEVRGDQYLTFNPGIMMGGTTAQFDSKTATGEVFGKGNVMAQTAWVRGDLRFISEAQKERARARMREIVGRNLPRTSAEISFIDLYPAMPPTPGNQEVLEELSRVSQDLGHGPVTAYDPGGRGAADISHVAPYIACLDGLGSMGSGAHTPQETVNLKTLEALTQRTALLMYRLTRDSR